MFHPLPASMVAAEAAYRSEKVKHDFQRSQGGWFSGRVRRSRKVTLDGEFRAEQTSTPIQLPRQREADATPVRLPEPAEPVSDHHVGVHAA